MRPEGQIPTVFLQCARAQWVRSNQCSKYIFDAQGNGRSVGRCSRPDRYCVEISTLETILKVYGIRIGFFPEEKHEHRRAA